VVEEGEGKVGVVIPLTCGIHQRGEEMRVYRWLEVAWRWLACRKCCTSGLLCAD
jgi:hypothetical protein